MGASVRARTLVAARPAPDSTDRRGPCDYKGPSCAAQPEHRRTNPTEGTLGVKLSLPVKCGEGFRPAPLPHLAGVSLSRTGRQFRARCKKGGKAPRSSGKSRSMLQFQHYRSSRISSKVAAVFFPARSRCKVPMPAQYSGVSAADLLPSTLLIHYPPASSRSFRPSARHDKREQQVPPAQPPARKASWPND